MDLLFLFLFTMLSAYLRFLKNISIKNGAPISAVTAPTGISLGERMVLDIRSAMDMNAPPYKKLMGITALCFAPKIFLTACGATRSINPIIPANDTDTPVSREVITMRNIFLLFVLTPMDIACSSPNVMMSSYLELIHMISVIRIETGARIATCVQFLDEKDPIIQ